VIPSLAGIGPQAASKPAPEQAEAGRMQLREIARQMESIFFGMLMKSMRSSVKKSGFLSGGFGEETFTQLFDLEVAGARRKVILKECQIEPLESRLLHADFYEIALDRPIEVMVHVEVTGTPVGVKVEGGILDFVTRELKVECLPLDIPEKITVDVSHLALGKHLRVSELKAPDKVKILTEPEVVIVHIVAPRAEAEAAPAAEAAPVEGAVAAEPEVIKKGKAVEGEAAEAKPEKPEKPEKKEKK